VGLTLLLVTLLGLGAAAPVSAHQSAATGVVRLAQSLGDRDLTVTLVPPPDGSGRMSVAVEALGTGGGAPVRVRAEPVGMAGGTATGTEVRPGRVGTPGLAALTVDRPGRWDVVLDDGGTPARIPMTYVDPGTPAWVWLVRVGVALAVVAGIAATTRTARRRRWAAGALGGLAVVGATAAVTAFTLGTSPAPAAYVVGGATGDPAAVAPATHDMAGMAGMGGMAGMPPTTGPASMTSGAVVLSSALTGPPGPSGAGSVLDLRLADGSTGAPVDDLAVHDDAFIHLAVLGADGSEAHLHPVRTGPGRWQVRFAPATGGRYGLFAEFSRADGGDQVVRSAVDVPGPPGGPAAVAGPGPRSVAGMVATVTADDAVVGRPARVRMSLIADGRPVTDLQAWLGMAGHLFVLGPGRGGAPDPTDVASSFAHVHDMQPVLPARALGPEVDFDHVFPQPGPYRLWLQVLRGAEVVTVPVDLAVAPAPAGA
jgi:hypothetical protein